MRNPIAVVAIAAFLRNLFTVPVARPLLLIALISFAISVLFSMFFISAYTELEVMDKHSRRTRWFGSSRVSLIAESSFFIGFVSLAVFIIYNFWFMDAPSGPEALPTIN